MKPCISAPCLLGACPGEACRFYKAPDGLSEERLAELRADCDKGTVHVFSSGSQHYDWRAMNCGRCAKAPPDGGVKVNTCEIEYSIAYACIADGKFSEAIAARLGNKPGHYGWKCPEWRSK